MNIGQVIGGRFCVEGSPIGEGRSGVVWPGRDTATGQLVAIKVLHPALSTDPAALTRLQADAGLAARLEHPNILPVLGVWAEEGRWYLVSARAGGGSLQQAAPVGLPVEAVLALGLDVASALEAAHGRGVVHGDVRPGNVLLDERGGRLFDFGVTALPEEDAHVHPGETAPEVVRGGPRLPVGDLYGLGVILYRAATGKLPFPSGQGWAKVGAQRAAPAVRIAGAPGLSALIRALLDPDPLQRPRSARDVVKHLQALQRNPSRRWRRAPWVPPLRLTGEWAVTGIDPTTGAPCVVVSGVRRRVAVGLESRLRAEGWQVQALKEGLGAADLAWIVALTTMGLFAIPLLGGPVALILSLIWRSRGALPHAQEVLPACKAPLPPVRMAPRAEVAVALGLCLVVGGPMLLLFPPLGLLLMAVAVWIAWSAWAQRTPDATEVAARARVEIGLDVARKALEAKSVTDELLGLQGELQRVEADWRNGAAAEVTIDRVERLLLRIGGHPGIEDQAARRALESLRRTHAEEE